jgi:glycosyltransferase involved in cell wall biosynthesis
VPLQPADAPDTLVSIVVPCYLGTPAQAALLDETLRTITAQTYDRYEVILT